MGWGQEGCICFLIYIFRGHLNFKGARFTSVITALKNDFCPKNAKQSAKICLEERSLFNK